MWTTTVWVWVLLLNGHWSQATKRGKHKSAQDITRTYKHSINFDFWLHLQNSWQISFNVHWQHRRCTAVSCLWDRGPEGWCRFSKLIFWLWQLAEITTFSTSSLSSLQSLDSPIYLQAHVARQPRVQEKATTEQSAATALGSQNHPQVLDISRYYLDITENIMNETHI